MGEFGMAWDCHDTYINDPTIPNTDKVTQKENCFKDQATSRWAFSFGLVLLLLFILSLAGQANTALMRFWVLKFTVPAILPLIFLLIPNGFFVGVDAAATVFGALFMIFQMMLLFDLGYNWNAVWIDNARQDRLAADWDNESAGRNWYIALFVAGLFFVISSLGCAIALSCYYSSLAALPVNLVTWIPWSLAACLTVVSVTQWCKHGALLPSGILMLYFSFMIWVIHSFMPFSDDAFWKSGVYRYNDLSAGRLTMIGFGWSLGVLSLLLIIRNPNLLLLADGTTNEGGDIQAGGANEEDSSPVVGDNGENTRVNDNGDVERLPTPGGRSSRQNGAAADVQNLPHIDAADACFFLGIHTCATFYFRMLFIQRNQLWSWITLVIALGINVLLFGYATIAPQMLKDRNWDDAV